MRAGSTAAEATVPDAEALGAAARALAAREDPEHGGFWGGDPSAPKFPVATALRFLQTRAVRERAEAASVVADRALAAMASSELRDPVEGGFFRYATRRDWTVPHFERMLTDNAQLLEVAIDAGDVETARGVAAFLLGVLRQPGGGFGAAQDSESWIDGARSEGGYYARDAAARRDLERPAVDGKVVTGWNGLAIGALARAGARLGEPAWIEGARVAAEAVLAANTRPGWSCSCAPRSTASRPARRRPSPTTGSSPRGSSRWPWPPATSDTRSAPANSSPRASRPTVSCAHRPGWIPCSRRRVSESPDAASDGDEPSGVAALAGASTALWLLGAGDEHRALAEQLVAAHSAEALAEPLAHSALLRVAALLAVPPRQVVVIADEPDDPLAVAARGMDAEVVAIVTPAEAQAWSAAGFALFDEKTQRDGRATAYDCRDFACRLPVTDPVELADPGR